MNKSRITIFAGHYGSGKTNLSVNYALALKKHYSDVVVCDLDIVNPYFRTRDAADQMERHGVTLISSQYANSNVDLPSIPPAAASIMSGSAHVVIDVGGDDRGALALGRYAEALSGTSCEMLLVINKFRPLTRDIHSLLRIKSEIEAASKLRFTGIVNNSNLGAETTLKDVIGSAEYAAEVCDLTGLPLKMTAVNRKVFPAEPAQDGLLATYGDLANIFLIDILEKEAWRI